MGSGEGRGEVGEQGRELGPGGLGGETGRSGRPESGDKGRVGTEHRRGASHRRGRPEEEETSDFFVCVCVRMQRCGPSWGEVLCVGWQCQSLKQHVRSLTAGRLPHNG